MLIWTSQSVTPTTREWCADGDGMLVIRATRTGYRVLDQNARRYVGRFESLPAATAAAEAHMRAADPVMYAYLSGV